MADEITEQLLDVTDRSSWCGDTDPTGRYVCQRIRDHALDWHAARNDKGGVHQWKAGGVGDPRENMPAAIPATSDPADDPVGAVRVHPDDDPKLWDARRVMFVSTRTERPWWGIVGDPFGLPAMSHDEVLGWQPQSLADLAVALGHAEPSVDAAVRERLRATNESLLAMLERMETLHVTFRGPDGEEIHPDWCRECRVDKVRAELDDLERQRDEWWNQRAAERDTLSRMLRGMARRASGQRRSKERLAMWAEGRRPAIPSDAVDRLVHAAESCPPGPDHADRLTRSYRRFFRAWGLDQPASSVGTDTTAAQSVDAVIERMNQFVGKRVLMEMSPDADDGALFGNGLAGVVARVHTNVWVYVDHGPGMCALAEGFKIREIPAVSSGGDTTEVPGER